MRLSVEKITDLGADYTVSLTAEELNCQLGRTGPNTSGPFVGVTVTNYHLARVERRLIIDGRITAELSLQCGRCLKNYTEPLQETFSLVLNLVKEVEVVEGEELELAEDQINSIPIFAGEVDLSPVLLEQAMIRLPVFSVCSDNCAGLCPHCGENLNLSSCGCEPRPFNNRFGKLKGIKLDRSQ